MSAAGFGGNYVKMCKSARRLNISLNMGGTCIPGGVIPTAMSGPERWQKKKKKLKNQGDFSMEFGEKAQPSYLDCRHPPDLKACNINRLQMFACKA